MGEISKLTVVVLVFVEQSGKLLLVKQAYGQQYWSLPGGVVEAGESLDQAAVREVREETGLDITLKRVVGLYSKPQENALAITLEGRTSGGVLNPDHEISECRFFPLDQLPTRVRGHFHQRVDDYMRQNQAAVIRTQ